MERLPRRDLEALLDFLRAIYAVGSLETFQRQLTIGLPRVVPVDLVAYSEVGTKSQHFKMVSVPRDPLDFPDSGRILKAHLHQSPLVGAYRRGKGSAVKISDFLTRQQFERTALYNEFFRRFGCVYQIAKGLPGPVGVVTSLALNRRRRDFSETDRLLLNLLGPHLNQAYQNTEAMSRVAAELEALRRGVEQLDYGMIIVGRERRVSLMTDRARQLLTDYFGPLRRGNRLPDPMERWIGTLQAGLQTGDATARPLRPLLVERQGKCLVARLISDREQSVVLVDEQKEKAVQPERLEALGLSRRQAEVLVWVVEGKTNGEIGVILGMSVRTVEKHLEHIFRKLGVETRTAAVSRALTVAVSP